MATHTLLLLVFIIKAVNAKGDAESPPCPGQQQAFEGSCFEFVAVQLSFLSAQGWCERSGGHLAFIHNYETQKFLQEHLRPDLDWWLGLAPASFDLGLDSAAGSLSWLDGSDVSYSNWLSEPMATAGCAYISKHSGFQWRTSSNCSQEFYFICEFESGHSLACADHKAKLQCRSGEVIEIGDSFYGIKTLHYCGTSSSSSDTSLLQQCGWVDVVNAVSELCNGQRFCEVAADDMPIADPCPGLENYLSIKYHCKDEPQIASIGAKPFSSKFKRSATNNVQKTNSDEDSSSSNGKSNDNNSSKENNSSNGNSNQSNSSNSNLNGNNSSGGKSNDNNSSNGSSNGNNSSNGNSNENNSSEGKSNDNNSSNGNSNDNNSSNGKSNDNNSSNGNSNGNNSSNGSSNGNNSSNGNSNGNNSSNGKSNENNSSEGKSNENNSSNGSSNGNNSSNGNSNGNNSSNGKSNENNSSEGKSNENNSSKGNSNGNNSSNGNSNGNNSSNSNSNGNNSSNGNSNGNNSSNGNSNGNNSSNSNTNGNNSSNGNSNGNNSSNGNSNGNNSSNGNSNGNNSSNNEKNSNDEKNSQSSTEKNDSNENVQQQNSNNNDDDKTTGGTSNGASKENNSTNQSNNNNGSKSPEDTSGKGDSSKNGDSETSQNEQESTCITITASNAFEMKITCSNCDPVNVDNTISLQVDCTDCQNILWYFEDTAKYSALANSCSKDKGQMLLKQQATNVSTFAVPNTILKAAKQNISVVAFGSKDRKSGYGYFTIPLLDDAISPSNQNNIQTTISPSSQNNAFPLVPPPGQRCTTSTIPGTSTARLPALTCTIDPSVGDILSPFNITCTTAQPFCCSGPCSFCLTTIDGNFLYCGNNLGMISLFLPLGNIRNYYTLGLRVTVKNVEGQTINTTLFPQVRDTSCDTTIQDLQTLVSNYVTELQQRGLFSASMLVQMFQSVTKRLNKDLNNDDKSAKKKLREEMLSDMCAALTNGELLKIAMEVKITADVVLSLVSQEDELIENAMLLACCALNRVSKSLISISPTEGDVLRLQAATPIIQAASKILKVSANTEKQRELSSLLFNITDNVQSALLANKKPNQEPAFLTSPLISLYVNRLSSDQLQNHLFSIENSSSASFMLPFLGPGVLPSVEPVDVWMLSFGINPFSWSKGDPISGVVGGLSLTRENGSVIPVTNLRKEIEVLLPRSEAVVLNSTFLDLRNFSTLAINVTTPNTSLVLKLEPSEKISLQLYLGFQYYPNDTNYKAKMQLPYLENPPDQRYTWVITPNEMAVEAGIYYLLVRPIVVGSVNSSNTTVDIMSFAAQCKYWEETKTNWSDYGCRVGPRTTPLLTQCLCTHLTFFGSSFFVMPNKVDVSRTAELFATFFQNPVVACFVCSVFLAYVLVAIWARRKDLQDKVKVKVTVLEDNDPLAEYRYLLVIATGHRRGASTSSHVTVTLTGSEWESEPHHLTDPDKPVFERGGVDVFLLTTPISLGELQSVRLWHDNSGKHPAWYVSKVMVQDLETGQKWHFLCRSWLAIDMGACTLDKVFTVATDNDLKGFSNLFLMKTTRDLCDGHIWFSVINRPANSTFTRVQRVSCCFSLLLCTMLTSIIFWGVPKDPSEQSTDVGGITFSWKQVMIGIESSIIAFPVNLLIVSIFRFTRPRKKIQKIAEGDLSRSGSPQQEKEKSDILPQWCKQTDITVEYVIKDIKRILRLLAKAASCPVPKLALECNKTDINRLLSHVENIIRQQDLHTGKFAFEHSQTELVSVYSVYRQHLHKQLQNLEKELRLLSPSQFSKPGCYNQAMLQIQSMKALLEPHLFDKDDVACVSSPEVDSSEGSKKCCQKSLPWWFVFVGWFLVVATSGVSGYFTMMYGLTYGKDRSISWLISMTVSFFESLLLTQPIKVLGFAVFFALVVKSVDNDEDDSEYISMVKSQVITYSDDPDDVRISRRDSTCSFYQPPPPSDIGKMKANMIKDQKAAALILEILIYLGFLCTLLWAAYGQRDPNAYFLSQHIQQSFKNGISYSMTHEDVFTWAHSTVLKNIFGPRSGFITDGNSKLVGYARLRQVRVQKGSCRTASSMRPSIPDCHAPYSWELEDMGSYGPGWNASVGANISKILLTPWQYQTQATLRTHPVWGDVALYRGGGYVVDLGPDQQNASSVLQYLFNNTWLDVYTRAVFIEFTVYNANVNLFCIVTLMLETTAVGAFQYRSELQNVRLFQTTDGIHVLVSEAIYFLFILYFMFVQCKLIKQQKWQYFRNKWNLLDLAIILLSWSAFSVFIKRMVQGNQDLNYYHDHKNQFPSFYETAAADTVLGYIIAFLVLLATIKMWHLMRLNAKMNMITATLQRAWTDISSFIVVIIIMFLAYSIASNLLFGWKLYTYKTILDAAMAMVSLQLGIFNYDEVLNLNPVIGAFLIGSCIIFMTFVVLNLFISVILEAFSQQRQHHKPSEEEEIVDLMNMKICSFFGIKTKKTQ